MSSIASKIIHWLDRHKLIKSYIQTADIHIDSAIACIKIGSLNDKVIHQMIGPVQLLL